MPWAETPPRRLDGGAAIEVKLGGLTRRFHAIWLRDNAQDPATRDPGNGQRLITLTDIPRDTRIAEVGWVEGQLRIVFAPEDKAVLFDPAWLIDHAYDGPRAPAVGWTDPGVTRWDAGFVPDLPAETYDAVRLDAGARRRWLEAVRRFGVARLTGAPIADGAVCDVAALFGYVRETNYGRWFDVRAKVDPVNLAYSRLGLSPHTDNPYRDPAPTLQILMCLANSAAGGASVVVDGFAVARAIQDEHPEDFDLLTRHCARFNYAGMNGVRLSAKRPLLELGADGELIAVRFNNRSAAAFTDIPYEAMAAYYAAYRRMVERIEDPAFGVRFTLEPGELFIVDNLRVQHGRTAFSGAGQRWLQGCYADRDGLLSTLAALEAAEAGAEP